MTVMYALKTDRGICTSCHRCITLHLTKPSVKDHHSPEPIFLFCPLVSLWALKASRVIGHSQSPAYRRHTTRSYQTCEEDKETVGDSSRESLAIRNKSLSMPFTVTPERIGGQKKTWHQYFKLPEVEIVLHRDTGSEYLWWQEMTKGKTR